MNEKWGQTVETTVVGNGGSVVHLSGFYKLKKITVQGKQKTVKTDRGIKAGVKTRYSHS